MKKFIAAFVALAILAVAVPTFAAIKEVTCGICYGSGKCKYCRGTRRVAVFHWERNKKGKKVRVPPYQKNCSICYVKGKCNYYHGKGKVTKRY